MLQILKKMLENVFVIQPGRARLVHGRGHQHRSVRQERARLTPTFGAVKVLLL